MSTMSTFDFFGLPKELRNMVYDNLTTDRRHGHALIQPTPQDPVTHIRVRRVFIPKLLRINKQFKAEYLEEVIPHQLAVEIALAPPRDQKKPPSSLTPNPGTLLQCLSQTRELNIRVLVYRRDHLTDYVQTFESKLSSLLAAMPSLKHIQESFLVVRRFFELLMLRQDDVLRILDGQSQTVTRAVSCHAKKATRRTEIMILGGLFSELETRKGSKTELVIHRAVPGTGMEKEEYLWYGFSLEFVESWTRKLEST